MNITDEELLQEILKIIDKAPLTEQIALTNLIQRYQLAVSVAEFALPGFPLGVLDFLAVAVPMHSDKRYADLIATNNAQREASGICCHNLDKTDERYDVPTDGNKYH